MHPHENLEVVTYSPNPVDKLHGLIGRLGNNALELGAVPPQSEGQQSINELLDHYEANNPTERVLQADNMKAHDMLTSLAHTPQFDTPLFIPKLGKETEDKHRHIVTINAVDRHPVKLPTRNFVSAAGGMRDWIQGRPGPKKDGRSSRSIIREYASKRTAQPPIGFVHAYIQPNGNVLYDVAQNGAHTVAAAHLRGDRTISTSSVVINRLNHNVL